MKESANGPALVSPQQITFSKSRGPQCVLLELAYNYTVGLRQLLFPLQHGMDYNRKWKAKTFVPSLSVPIVKLTTVKSGRSCPGVTVEGSDCQGSSCPRVTVRKVFAQGGGCYWPIEQPLGHCEVAPWCMD